MSTRQSLTAVMTDKPQIEMRQFQVPEPTKSDRFKNLLATFSAEMG